jgi:plasmid stability protein
MADVSIRNVPDEVVERLRTQAAAEGVSLSEWVRQTLGDRAALPSPGELAARRLAFEDDAQQPDEFGEYYRSQLHRRTLLERWRRLPAVDPAGLRADLDAIAVPRPDTITTSPS